jgi:hypothetical protein
MAGEAKDGGQARDAKGKLGKRKALTAKQVTFSELVANGVNSTVAARVSGYSHPHIAAHGLKRHPAVQAKMRSIREGKLEQVAALAIKALGELIRDKHTPPAIKLQAISTALDRAGHAVPSGKAGPAGPDGRELRELSTAELEAIVAKRFGATAPAPGTIEVVPSGTTANDPVPMDADSALAKEGSEASGEDGQALDAGALEPDTDLDPT